MAQFFNLQALKEFPKALLNKKLRTPKERISSINDLAISALKKKGIKALIFDKDNTLTLPYTNEIHPSIRAHLRVLQKEFITAIFSNSIGSSDDTNNVQAIKSENELNIKVITHQTKKPNGFRSITKLTKCKPKEIAFIGDRIYTDIVFANKHKAYSIKVEPINTQKDPWYIRLVRRIED